MSAWKKPSRNTWVKKMVTPSRASLANVHAGVAQPLDLADRNAVHALHHDHVGVAEVPVHLGDHHQVRARPCCGAAGRRWPPRAPGPARRAGTCRTRPPPRAASGAGRRPRALSTQPAIMAHQRQVLLDHRQHARAQHLHGDLAQVPPVSIAAWRSAPARSRRWPPARARSWRRSSSTGRRKARSMVAIATLEANGGTRSCSRASSSAMSGGQQVAAGRQHLAELDEDRAQVLQRHAQALAARRRRGRGRTDRTRASARSQGRLEAGEDQLVQAVAQGHPDDEDRRADSASCAGLPRTVGALGAGAGAGAAPRPTNCRSAATICARHVADGVGGRVADQRATGLPRGPSARGRPAS